MSNYNVVVTYKLKDEISPTLEKIKKNAFAIFSDINNQINNLNNSSRNLFNNINRQQPNRQSNRQQSVTANNPATLQINADPAINNLNRFNRQLSNTANHSQSMFSKIKEFGSSAFLPLIGIGAAIGVGKGIIQTTSEFQKYTAVLTNALGSTNLAKKSMSEIQKFAAATPFSVNELTDSFVKMNNYGIRLTMSDMTKMGDLASSVGKGFGQLTEAIADSVVGENERLKEFGIKAKKMGDSTIYTFKGVSTQIKNNSKDIKNYILSLGDLSGVKGTMSSISGTIGGQLSNLGDNISMLFAKIGNGSSSAITTIITNISNLITKIGNLYDWLTGSSTSVNAFKAVVITLTAAFAAYNLVSAISIARLTLTTWWTGMSTAAIVLNTLVTEGWSAAFLALNMVMEANIIGLIVTGIVALVAAIMVCWDKFEGFRGVVMGVFEVVKKYVMGIVHYFMNLGKIIADVFNLITHPLNFKKNWEELKKDSKSFVSDFKKDFTEGWGDTWKKGVKEGKANNFRFLEKNADPNKSIKDQIAETLAQTEEMRAKNRLKISDTTTTNKATKGDSTTQLSSQANYKNLTINIDKLVEKFEVITNNMSESPEKIKQLISRALTEAIIDNQSLVY